MNENTEMKVTYISPDQLAFFVAELPDGGFGVWTQRAMNAPRKVNAGSYFKREGYATKQEAQKALDLYVVNKRSETYGQWDVYVNGKRSTFDELVQYGRGTLPLPAASLPAAQVTLANLEYRIASHIQGAYENLLEVGRCLNEAKEAGLVPHGEWEAWVRRNTNMSERQAQKLMQAARSVLPGGVMERLPISKIQAILTLPEPEREPMAAKAESESLTLRELQAKIKEQQARADVAEKRAKNAEAALTNAKVKQAEQQAEADKVQQFAQDKVQEILHLRKELEAAQAAAPTEGISAEAQAEIDRLKNELDEAERFAEEQAEQRQKAQQDMLAMQSQAARGELATGAEGFSSFDLAAAVRAFIGTAGVVPHMGTALARMSAGDREQLRQNIEMVAAWVDGAREALGTIVVAG